MQKGFTIVELLIVIVVIAVLAAISIVAYNGITNRARSSAMALELSQWKKKAETYKITNNIECPNNYIFVYGNSVLGTNDFCVMKYEAKILGNDDGTTTYNSSMVPDSRPTGTPWTGITQSQAIARSSGLGTGYHLITEAEWMTIAADVLSVKYNWTEGEVGAGMIYKGHVNSNPNSGLTASVDDTDTLNGMTGGFGTTNATNNSRVLWLSSGDAIWDFSGNVWEFTQQAIGSPTLVMSNVGVSGDSAFAWRDYALGSLSLGNMANISKPTTLNTWTNPRNNVSLSGIAWDSSTGAGKIQANYADTGTRAFFRGGNWSAVSNGGILALSLNYSASTSGGSVGFRVAKQ